MAKDATQAYVEQYLGVLGEDVKEQNERIAELDAWLEADDIWEHERAKMFMASVLILRALSTATSIVSISLAEEHHHVDTQ